VFIARFYRSKYVDQNPFETNALFQSNQIEFIKNVRNKVIIGLENVNQDLNLEFQKIPLLNSDSTPKSTLDFFPSEIKQELQSKIKSKTIFTLIEIAYQDPTETNPAKISKSLNVPPSTLSREIKKLISLNYLQPYISDVVMLDTRLKNFQITEKGFIFLQNLKNALNSTIAQFKEREIEKNSQFSL
jgi:DNA-binding MarR family transcriptional regulator